jgi:glycosyltransferase involved in cell wall biosynthesis
MMRIGLVIYGRLDLLSGGYLYDRKLVNHLVAAGDEVEIISLPSVGYGRHLLQNFSKQLRWLEQGQFDLVLEDELNHPSLFWANRRLRVPIVTIVHHLRSSETRPGWQNRFYAAVERRFLQSVDGYIFNSETTRDVVTAMLGVQPGKHIIANPAADHFDPEILPSRAEIRLRTARSGPLQLIFVGNLIPRKGLLPLLRVLSGLSPEIWQLDIVGDTAADMKYSRQLFDFLAQSGLDEQVMVHGRLSDHDLAVRLRESDLLVVPSFYEGFGIVYLEGMAFGLPAIGTTGGAAREIINHGENGFLLPVDDISPLQEILRRLAVNRHELMQLAVNARARFDAQPGWEENMAAIRTFLLQVVKQQ